VTGAVVWFTGLPASGKTTLAERARDRIGGVLLDGDALRDVLGAHAYSPEERDDFYRRLGALAALLATQGHIVLVAATAPRRAHRERARALAPRFVEVWVTTSLVECERRDPKQLYARARAGEVSMLPGVGADYEPPLAPEVTATGGFDDAAVVAVERAVVQAGCLDL
jgi:adenylylsulfate kinase